MARTAKTARAYLWHFSDKIDRILLRHREFKETAATEGDSTMDYIRAVQSNSDGKHQRNVRNTVLKNLLRPIFKFKDPMRSATKEQRRLLYNEGDPICPDCGVRQALDSIGIEPEERERILDTIHRFVW